MRTRNLLVISAICLSAYDGDIPWWLRIPLLVGAFLPLLFVGDRIDAERDRTSPREQR